MEATALLSATHDRLHLVTDVDLSATGVEQLIRTLAEFRARMVPIVPTSLDAAIVGDAGVLRQKNPSAMFGRLADGGLRIWLRSVGLGWLAFELSATDVDSVGQLITQQVTDRTRPH